jgi:hypothetical protein
LISAGSVLEGPECDSPSHLYWMSVVVAFVRRRDVDPVS